MLITQATDITPAWLTQALVRRGVLHQGTVRRVTVVARDAHRGFVADTASLDVAYSDDVDGPVPTRLFLKVAKPGLAPEVLALGEREVAFYHAMAAGQAPAIVRCYDAVYDMPSRRSHVLLDDLSATHFQRPSPIPPTPVELEGLVEVLAGLHAQWWASSRLDTELGELWDQDERHAQRQRLDATLPGFLDVFGAALLPVQRVAYEHILASSLWQRRDERLRQRRAVTLLHGDCHTGNILLPRDPARDRAMLIDWHLWEVGPGTDDLAFFMAHKWAPMRRAVLEQPLVRRYHGELVAQGIADYTWDDCWRDYRESVALTALVPIGQFRRQAPAAVIWFGMETILAAFQDLACHEVL